MPRKITLPPPANPLDPEIARAMVTWEIRIPSEEQFEGSLTEEELAEIKDGNTKMLLAMSAAGKVIDWNTDTIVDVFKMVRLVDAELAREKIHRQKKEDAEAEQQLVWKVLKWIGVTVGAGVLSALAQKLF